MKEKEDKMNQLKKERLQIILVNLATLVMFAICLLINGIHYIGTYIIFGIFEIIFIIAFLDNLKGIKNYEENCKRERFYMNSIKRR